MVTAAFAGTGWLYRHTGIKAGTVSHRPRPTSNVHDRTFTMRVTKITLFGNTFFFIVTQKITVKLSTPGLIYTMLSKWGSM